MNIYIYIHIVRICKNPHVGIVHGTSDTKSLFYAMLGSRLPPATALASMIRGPPKVSTMRDMMDLEANHPILLGGLAIPWLT